MPAGRPDDAELERLGLYDPSSPGADEQLRLLNRAFELGATVDEAVRAMRLRGAGGLGPLMLDLVMRPHGETCDFELEKIGRMTLHVRDPLKREWERGVYMGPGSTNPAARRRQPPT